jgi:DNA-binding winged helix-turn-helix (wHTH) protein
MSSLKKYAFTPTLPAIALQDFTPSAETFHYDLNALATHSITLLSHPFNAARQEARMPTPKTADDLGDPHSGSMDIGLDRTQLYPQDFWLLTQHDRTLVKGGLRISLTAIESALIKKMLNHEDRVVSKEELIRNIGREPEYYRGLEMCLSRLQEKFKRANEGERLFRAVRNRGYCLTQKIKKPLEPTQTRR